jgi:hypothetical protein
MDAKDEATITRLTTSNFTEINQRAGELDYQWL